MRLEGQAALVTGGGSGLGAATAEALARAGAKVAILDVDEARAKEVASRIGGIALRCDVTDAAAAEAALAAARDGAWAGARARELRRDRAGGAHRRARRADAARRVRARDPRQPDRQLQHAAPREHAR